MPHLPEPESPISTHTDHKRNLTTMNATAPILRLEGLTKTYRNRKVVDQLGFSMHKGETVGFLGANGAGKSTTIRMLCHLVHPSAGQAWLEEMPMFPGTPQLRDGIGAVIEGPTFHPQLSGAMNLSLIARLRRQDAARVQTMLEAVGLSEAADAPFGGYSMGMKQRLGLAAAFLHNPQLIILDEPTSGLDPAGMQQIHKLIRKLRDEHGASVLLCSHQLDEVAALCERALVLERGKLVLDYPLDDEAAIGCVREHFERIAATQGTV